jgi:hypothetical protein
MIIPIVSGWGNDTSDHSDRVIDDINTVPRGDFHDFLLPIGLCVVHNVIRAAVYFSHTHFAL